MLSRFSLLFTFLFIILKYMILTLVTSLPYIILNLSPFVVTMIYLIYLGLLTILVQLQLIPYPHSLPQLMTRFPNITYFNAIPFLTFLVVCLTSFFLTLMFFLLTKPHYSWFLSTHAILLYQLAAVFLIPLKFLIYLFIVIIRKLTILALIHLFCRLTRLLLLHNIILIILPQFLMMLYDIMLVVFSN